MSIGPRRGSVDNRAMRKVMNEEYGRQQDRLNDKTKISQNTHYEIDKRSGFRLVGLLLVTNWVTTMVFTGILGLLIYIAIR